MLRAEMQVLTEHGSGASHRGVFLRLRRVRPLLCATVNRKGAVSEVCFVRNAWIKVVPRMFIPSLSWLKGGIFFFRFRCQMSGKRQNFLCMDCFLSLPPLNPRNIPRKGSSWHIGFHLTLKSKKKCRLYVAINKSGFACQKPLKVLRNLPFGKVPLGFNGGC